jgi:sulfate adenylyltransferase small subunit
MAKTQQKKLAAQLREAGKSLEEVARMTNLSRPTIIKAHKEHLNPNLAPKKAVGRPALAPLLITPDLIQKLQKSPAILSFGELMTLFSAETGHPFNPRSFKRFLTQSGWLKPQGGKKNTTLPPGFSGFYVANLSSHAPKTYLLAASQKNGESYWGFYGAPPKDMDYLMMGEALLKNHPQGISIHTDITDLKYCPKLVAWQRAQPHLVSLFPSNPTTSEDAPRAATKVAQSTHQERVHMTKNLTHLQRLEAESIHIMREVVAEADNPVMLYSIGKDSAVMLHLALKAFHPAKIPFPLLHVDTTWKFQDMYAFRDQMLQQHGFELLIHVNPEGLEQGINPFIHGSQVHTDIMKTQGLKQALDKYQFDVAFGGARRDEEKSRAKERIFSFRNQQHRWDPKNQRPELWNLYNTRKNKGESIRVFPLSNWTELDVWQYIYLENIPIVPLYFAKERPVVNRDGTWIMVDDERMPLRDGEIPQMKSVRFRTLGCYPLTGAIESKAKTLPEIIQEMLLTKTSERQGRMIDHDSTASMEKKKQEGYF